jgi:hypothetical protein
LEFSNRFFQAHDALRHQRDGAEVIVRVLDARIHRERAPQRSNGAVVIARITVRTADEHVRLRDGPLRRDFGEQALGCLGLLHTCVA